MEGVTKEKTAIVVDHNAQDPFEGCTPAPVFPCNVLDVLSQDGKAANSQPARSTGGQHCRIRKGRSTMVEHRWEIKGRANDTTVADQEGKVGNGGVEMGDQVVNRIVEKVMLLPLNLSI
ncbi:hypothetical protein Cni_G28726 [Canna indica]|uniref:Uncharacterized protein n=1 Tax=Canna indica TaxID=4628 RepID=A0AAQ3L3I3_9LILI|nr:hypothetical protein Cni_G28726 [Canna indica]